jgi:hypothetical protein
VEEKFRSNSVQNSPFLEGVATEGRRGSVGNTRQDLFELTAADRLPTLPRRASPATPSKGRGILTEVWYLFMEMVLY